MLLASACRAEPQASTPGEVQRNPSRAGGGEGANPFIQPVADVPSGISVPSCFSMTLHVPTLRVGGSLSGELNAKNHCPCSVAVMTAPVELRVRLSRQVMFPVEDGIGNVYSIAYFFKEEVGLGKDAFRGDGGMAVASPPAFAVVGPDQELRVPVTGKLPSEVAPGMYGLAVMTMAAPIPGARPKPGSVELDYSVERFQRGQAGHGSRMVLAEGVVRLAPVTFFSITP